MKRYLLLIFACILFFNGCQSNLKTLKLGNEASSKKILFAGVTSEFKQEVLNKVIEKISNDNYFIKIIGLDDLKTEDTSGYGAIVLINTLMAGSRDNRVIKFLETDPTNKKVIVFTTVGSEGRKWPLSAFQVDSITSASKADSVEQRANELVELILKRF